MHSSIETILLALTLPFASVVSGLSAPSNVTEKPYDPIVEVISANSNELDCEPDWYPFGNKCFKYHNDLVGSNLHDAITICEKTYLGQLATIHSEEESQFLTSLLFGIHKSKFSSWIGLVRISNSTFTWLDRSPLNYTNWAPNEPNNWANKNFCVVLSSETNFLGKWYDVGCTSTYVVICEKPKKTSQMQAKEALVEQSIDQLKANWTALQSELKRLGHNLTSIESHFDSNLSQLQGNLLAFKSQFSTLSINQTFGRLNLSDMKEDLSQLNSSLQAMWSMVQLNLALIIILFILLASFFIYQRLYRFGGTQSTTSSPISRRRLWFTRSNSTSAHSKYVPSRLDRFYRSTLGKLKPAKSFPSPLSASYTAPADHDTESILTSENMATSI